MHDGYKGGGRVLCGAIALLAMYFAGIALFDEGALRGGVIGASGLIILLLDPIAERHKDAAAQIRATLWQVDVIMDVAKECVEGHSTRSAPFR